MFSDGRPEMVLKEDIIVVVQLHARRKSHNDKAKAVEENQQLHELGRNLYLRGRGRSFEQGPVRSDVFACNEVNYYMERG